MEKRLQQVFDEINAQCQVAGAAIALVDGDDTTLFCLGEADPRTKRPVTADSFFDLASNSKAFTTMLGAIASDEGLFDWDAPVVTYLPQFAMHDPYVTRHVTARDMACHRTGVPRHDFMRTRVKGTRQDTVLRSAHMQMNRGFREVYQYNNQFYIVLGHVLEMIYGKTWEELVADKIAAPLGMEMRFRGPDCDLSGLDCALPHGTDGHRAIPCGYANSPVSGPCGGIRTNLKSMVSWLKCMMGKGTVGNVRLCSEDAWRQLVTPSITCVAEVESEREKSSCYALAWHTSVYHGHDLVHHSGSVDGFNSRVGFFPALNKGYVFLTNTNGTPALRIFQQLLCDTLLDAPQENYDATMAYWLALRQKGADIRTQIAAAHPLTDMGYCGTFFHPAFDDFTIASEGGRLMFRYGGFAAPLVVMANGSVRGWGADGISPFWVQLEANGEGMRFECADHPGLSYQFVRQP